MAHGRKKAPAGYRWKTVTIPGSRPKSFTTKHVLVPSDPMEAKFKEAELESYKAFAPYPGQATDPDRDLPSTEVAPTSWLDQILAPIKDIPVQAEAHLRSGLEAVRDAPRGPLMLGQAAGAAEALLSPVIGAWKSLWDKPVADNLENLGMSKEAAANAAYYSGMAVPFAGQIKNITGVPRAINRITRQMRTTKGGEKAVKTLKDGVNSALTHTKVEEVLHAATRPKPKPTVRPAAAGDEGFARAERGYERAIDEAVSGPSDPKSIRNIRREMTKDAALRERAAIRDYERGLDEQAKLAKATQRPTVYEKSVVAKEPVQPRPTVYEKSVVAKEGGFDPRRPYGPVAMPGEAVSVTGRPVTVSRPPRSLADDTAAITAGARTMRPTVAAGETPVIERAVVSRPPRNLTGEGRRVSDDVLTRAQANAAIARINSMEASGLEAAAASRMRVAIESKVIKPPVSIADDTAALAAGRRPVTPSRVTMEDTPFPTAPITGGRPVTRPVIPKEEFPVGTPVRPTVIAGETAMPTRPTTPRVVGGDASRARIDAARAKAEADAAARAAASVGPPKPTPFVGPPGPSRTVLGPPKTLYTDPLAKAAAARKAAKTKQLAGLGLVTVAGGGYLYEQEQKRLAALAEAEKGKELIGGPGYQQWDVGADEAEIPDLGYPKQASGALPRTNKINGVEATEAQMSWAEKYYGAKFARNPAARYKKNKEFKQSLWKKMAILNAIAALTGNTSQAEQYATYALGMHEDAMQFDDDMRMHKMHKAVYFRPDGTFDPPKNNEQAYNRAIQIGASPDEAKEVYGFTPRKPSLKQWWRRDAKGDVITKQLPEGQQPTGDDYQWQQGVAREERVDTLSAIGKRVAERDKLILLRDEADRLGDTETVQAYQRNITAYDRDFDPNSSPSVRATRIWNIYKDLHKGLGGNLREDRVSFEGWVRDESDGGGAMWARMHGLSANEIMQGMGQSDSIVRISTQEEYNELPIGTIYIDSSGQTKKKEAESK